MSASATERAVSPVVGIALLLVITLLLAATVGAFALSLDLNRDTADGLVEGEVPTETGTAPETATSEPTPDANQDDLVVAENATAGADGVIHSTVIEVGDGAAGDEFDEITVEYPKEEVDLSLSHYDSVLTVGVDTDGDGDPEETFDGSDPGVNTNDDNSELTLTFDVDYTLAEGDRVQIRYGGADNPDSAGEYDVSVTLNSDQTVDGKLVVE